MGQTPAPAYSVAPDAKSVAFIARFPGRPQPAIPAVGALAVSSRPFHARAGDFGLHGQEAATAGHALGLFGEREYRISADKALGTMPVDQLPLEGSEVHASGLSPFLLHHTGG